MQVWQGIYQVGDHKEHVDECNILSDRIGDDRAARGHIVTFGKHSYLSALHFDLDRVHHDTGGYVFYICPRLAHLLC